MNIAEPDAKAIIQDAYYNLFIKAMRPVTAGGLKGESVFVFDLSANLKNAG